MKLYEILNPKEEKKEEEVPALLRPQAGPKLSRRDLRKNAHKARNGYKPSFFKRQAD